MASPPPATSMWRFLVDENLPRLVTQRLRAAGYDVEDARDVGLRSQPDSVVFAYAQAHSRTIVTLDKGLASITQYPRPHAGIVAARVPGKLSLDAKADVIMGGLSQVQGTAFADTVVIIEPGQVRVRR